MDWVSAKIALGGDQQQVLWRGPDRPVSWPEVRVLQHIHGDMSVFDCDYVSSAPSNVQQEKLRLYGIYGGEVVNLVYPGARPYIEMEFPGDKDPAGQKRPERRPVPTREDEPPIDAPIAAPPAQKRPQRSAEV